MLNRAALYKRIERMVVECEPARVTGVMILRAPRYLEFSILFGHLAADALDESMRDLIRRTLRPIDVVHPLGDGAFALLLPNLHAPNHAALAATRLVSAFDAPLQVGERLLSVAVAMGIAIAPDHGRTADDLCRHAEAACADAPGCAERFSIYRADAAAQSFSDVELRDAIENNRLGIHLQPIRSLQSDALLGAESLARWQEGERSIAPSLFVPLAEQTGMIGALTRWSLNTTLRYAAASRASRRDLFFAINLSPRALRQTDFVEQVLGALQIWQVPGENVVLELTETAIMEDPEYSSRVLSRLRDCGVRIAIDDFGTGYSSFSYLRQLPASELKIDISFVAGIRTDARVARLVGSMIALAHHLDMAVVAEGVEDATTLAMLREMGCDMAQGFHVGRPIAAAEFVAQLAPT